MDRKWLTSPLGHPRYSLDSRVNYWSHFLPVPFTRMVVSCSASFHSSHDFRWLRLHVLWIGWRHLGFQLGRILHQDWNLRCLRKLLGLWRPLILVLHVKLCLRYLQIRWNPPGARRGGDPVWSPRETGRRYPWGVHRGQINRWRWGALMYDPWRMWWRRTLIE